MSGPSSILCRSNQWLLLDTAFLGFTILGIGISPDLALVASYVGLVAYLWWGRPGLLCPFATASLLALGWTFIGNAHYRYAWDFLRLRGISFLPFFAWSLGLTGAWIFAGHACRSLPRPTFGKRLLFYALIYYPMLIFVETVVYHLFQLKNAATAAYPGLPNCACIHAPRWMQATYFALGPAFFLFHSLLELNLKRLLCPMPRPSPAVVMESIESPSPHD